jgi:hypothetical protein
MNKTKKQASVRDFALLHPNEMSNFLHLGGFILTKSYV